MRSLVRRLVGLAAIALTIVGASIALSSEADARGGRGGGFGSRGFKTFQAPPTTRTAPTPAKPIDKSITQPGQPGMGAPGNIRNATAPAAQASRFGSPLRAMLLGGLMGGLLASMLGAGTLSAVLGFILQTLLIGGIAYLAIAFFRGRFGARPAVATATGGNGNPAGANVYRTATGQPGGALPELQIQPADFDAFERLLGEIQTAYGRGDINALGERMTPEMLSNFAGELDQNAKQGVRNETGAPKLLQGDLAESWREPGVEWATVAMRYGLTDPYVEIATGRVVSGSRTETEEVTEVWTFRRPQGGTPGQWELSAIQQA